MLNVVWLVVFWLMQAAAQALFKYGSTGEGRWLFGFIAGNVFGASSIWFLMLLYRAMNPNLALALASAGGFVCAQLAVAYLFRSSVSLVQYAGMTAITIGMVMFITGNKS